MGHSISQNYSLLEKDILCPICLTVPPDKIFQCKNKHNFCQSCTDKLKKCPICKTSLKRPKQRVRNEAMEAALNSMRFTCPNRKYGCFEMSRREDIRAHVATCGHAPIHLCKHLGFSRCNFPVTDSNIQEYIEHLQSAHEHEILFLNKLSAPAMSPTSPTSHSTGRIWTKPILFDLSTETGKGNEYVIVIPHVKSTEKKDWDLWFTAVYLGKSKAEASKISVELSKRSENMSEVPEAEWRQLVIPITDIAKDKTKHLIKYRVHHEEINSKAFIKVDVRRNKQNASPEPEPEPAGKSNPNFGEGSTLKSGIPATTNTSEPEINVMSTSTEDLFVSSVPPEPVVSSTSQIQSQRQSQADIVLSEAILTATAPPDDLMVMIADYTDYLMNILLDQWLTGTIVLGSVATLWAVKIIFDAIMES